MDWWVYEGTRIQRLPRFLQPPALLVRNILVAAAPKFHHRMDGMTTRHNDGFRDTENFRRAYARSIQAAGWDFGIPYRVHQALWCSRLAQKVSGDFVELGTGRGFIMSAVLADFATWATEARRLHLFDTFASTWPDQAGKQTSSDPASGYYAVTVEAVRKNFEEWPRVDFHIGDVVEMLPQADIANAAFVHVDLNHWKPEVFALRHLWPRIPKGGVVLLDDYAHAGHADQYNAMNALGAELGFDILSTPTGQGIIVK